MRAAKPKASAGSRSGDMKTTSQARAQRARLPAMASAPAVPKTTDAAVAHTATIRLFHAASCICSASSSAAYQRNEYPGGGNFREGELVKEVRSTSAVGAMRNTMATPARTPKVRLRESASRLG